MKRAAGRATIITDPRPTKKKSMAGNGGKRSGAGRKPGMPNKPSAAREAKLADGGKPPNKVSAARAANLTDGGKLPLEFMLEQMRDANNDLAVRLGLAKAAAPYLHPKAAAVKPAGIIDSTVEIEPRSPADEARRIAFLLMQAKHQKPTAH